MDALSPEGVQFRRVSKSLATVRLIGVAVYAGIPTVALVVLGIFIDPWFYLGAALGLVLVIWMLWLIPRQVRAMQFATTETDFLVRRGIMFRRLDIVPYGRIQYVDVKEGPIARKLGIAAIQLHTASATTDAALDGLPAQQAAELRDLLVANGVSSLSGL
ncbi:PH domain-containing protein [Actinomyces minihominis]|uniref:PH domain-containing protein n=1 Tax=Actinomyces minihominis TaxID=2002838 RepID=UPI001F5CCC30|nr:PH domain-containing protein [Actinomyces minihominis]